MITNNRTEILNRDDLDSTEKRMHSHVIGVKMILQMQMVAFKNQENTYECSGVFGVENGLKQPTNKVYQREGTSTYSKLVNPLLR